MGNAKHRRVDAACDAWYARHCPRRWTADRDGRGVVFGVGLFERWTHLGRRDGLGGWRLGRLGFAELGVGEFERTAACDDGTVAW